MIVTQLMIAPAQTPGSIIGTVTRVNVVISDLPERSCARAHRIRHAPHTECDDHDEHCPADENRRAVEGKEEGDAKH